VFAHKRGFEITAWNNQPPLYQFHSPDDSFQELLRGINNPDWRTCSYGGGDLIVTRASTRWRFAKHDCPNGACWVDEWITNP
jgi:hypothetical protein